MQRREALRLLACAAALPLLSRDAFSLFQEVHDQLPASAALKTLSPEQNVMVTLISEIIIPQTDTPGAKGVRVNEFIDLILTEWYDHDERALFLAGLADVNARSRAKFSADFADCPEPQQTQIVAELDEDLTRFRESLPVPPPDPAPQKFFGMMKQLTLVGYYTSEAGFGDELQETIIPAGHAGCVPLEDQPAK